MSDIFLDFTIPLHEQMSHWLKLVENAQQVRPCVVHIGRQTYTAVRYTVQKVGDGDPFDIERFYCLFNDMLPPSWTKNRSVYVIEDKEWFMGSYHAFVEPWQKKNRYFPFGNMFSLNAEDVLGCKHSPRFKGMVHYY